MKYLLKNPFTIWLLKLYKAKKLEFIHKELFLKIGYMSSANNSKFGKYNTIDEHVSLNKVEMSDFTFIAKYTNISKTTIGKFCSIGPYCKIGLSKHPSNTFVSTHPIFFSTLKQSQITFVEKNYFEESEDITIGNDVWLGTNVMVVDGVIIGDGAIVAAGAVVTKNVPAYAIVGGVPAKIIRYRFEKDDIIKLLELKWWNMEVDYLKNNYKKFHDIKELNNDFN